MGFPLRSVPLSEGTRAFPPTSTHIPFHLTVLPPPERRAGPPSRGSWASTLPRVPRARRVINAPTAGYSLGVLPFEGLPAKALSGVPSGLLSRASQPMHPKGDARVHLRVSIGLRLVPSENPASLRRPDGTTLLGFPCQYDPTHSSEPASGLWVHLSPRRALLPTDRWS
jgi:hypothetical protein